MARLIVKTGQETGRSFEVDSETTVGRESADLIINDPEMSRRHAVVRPVQGGLEIEDAGSLNGTWVNGSRIESPTLLADGDRVEVGETSILVQIPTAESGRTVARPSPAGQQRRVATQEEGPAAPVQAPASSVASPVRSEPFGAFTPPDAPRRRRVATRRLSATIFAFAAIIATGVALVAYFAQR